MLRLVHGHSCENMVDRFNVKTLTIRKYTKIIINALAHNIFPKYIHTLSGEQLCRIIKSLETLLGCKTWPTCIDGCHIPLHEKPNERKTPTTREFYDQNSFHVFYYYKLYMILVKFFGMFIVGNLMDV